MNEDVFVTDNMDLLCHIMCNVHIAVSYASTAVLVLEYFTIVLVVSTVRWNKYIVLVVSVLPVVACGQGLTTGSCSVALRCSKVWKAFLSIGQC